MFTTLTLFNVPPPPPSNTFLNKAYNLQLWVRMKPYQKKKKKTFWLLFFLNEPFSLGISVDLYDLERLEGCRGQCWTHTSLLCNLWYLLFLSLSHYFSPRRLNPHPSARIKWRSGFGVVFYEWLEYQPVRFFLSSPKLTIHKCLWGFRRCQLKF